MRIPNLIISECNQRSHHFWNVNMKFMVLKVRCDFAADEFDRCGSRGLLWLKRGPSFVECKHEIYVSWGGCDFMVDDRHGGRGCIRIPNVMSFSCGISKRFRSIACFTWNAEFITPPYLQCPQLAITISMQMFCIEGILHQLYNSHPYLWQDKIHRNSHLCKPEVASHFSQVMKQNYNRKCRAHNPDVSPNPWWRIKCPKWQWHQIRMQERAFTWLLSSFYWRSSS